MSDDSGVESLPTGADHPARSLGRAIALSLALGLVGALTLLATHVAPQTNGLGLLPSQQSVLEQSGVTLQAPQGRAAIGAGKAVAAALAHQPLSRPITAILATAVGAGGSPISPPGRLCWVILLSPGGGSVGGAQVPGQIRLDAVLVDARSGAVIEGFISFRGPAAGSVIGSE